MSSNLLYFTSIVKILFTVLLLFDKISSGSPKPGNKRKSELTFVLLYENYLVKDNFKLKSN